VLTDRQFFLIAVILYGLSLLYSIFLWRRGFREDNRLNYLLLAAGAGFHSVAMFKRGFSLERCPVTNLYEAMTFIAWTLVATYLVIGVWRRLRFLGAFASPLLFAIGVFSLMPGLDVKAATPQFTGGLLSLHATLILLGYGGFALSCVAGIMYLTQEHDLKFHKMRAVLSLLPPIQRLEVVTSQALLVGFALFTAGLALSPMIMRPRAPGAPLVDPLIIWSILVWAIYLGLIVMRTGFARGGRRFAWGAVGTFSFVLLTFWGFYLLSGVHNP